jgi:oligopeptidase B
MVIENFASPTDGGPVAPRREHRLESHGDVRIDDWWWLRERDDPAVLAYLEAENAYTDAVLAPTESLQHELFEEIKRRVQEDDVSVPGRRGPWWYWSSTAEGAQYRAHHRLADPGRALSAGEVLTMARGGGGEQETVLDENLLAGNSEYFALGIFDVSRDQRLLAYATDLDGSEQYRLRFRDLSVGKDLADQIENVSYGSAWSTDNETFFYVRPDDAMRPHQIWAHLLGTEASADRLVYEEADQRFGVSVGLTRSERYIVIESSSKMTSEARYLDAARPGDAPALVLARRPGVEYDVDHAVLPEHGDVWLVRTNAVGADNTPATNFFVNVVPVGTSEAVDVLVAHDDAVKVEAVDVFATHVIVAERADGLERMRVIHLADNRAHLIAQPDPVYSLTGAGNAEWTSVSYRFGYTSLVTPLSTIEYDVDRQIRSVLKVQPVLGGYDPSTLRSERIWATASDGTAVPISLVAPAELKLDGSAPCVLYGYGSYEITIDPTFSIARLNLLERGFVYAIAHIRGGGELGRPWYEQGRLEYKANTFSDFVSCAQHLVDAGYTSPDRLVIRGGSAGGLLVGASTNLRPDLFAGVVAEVPFVDVVTTMQDESLPLTIGEWEEWGNPSADAGAYRYMLGYSPYDNVRALDYPAMYVTAGLNDPRVAYFEPAKWVAKLRATTTGDRPILLRTELGAGHGGPSGRYDAWQDEARVQAFILSVVAREG